MRRTFKVYLLVPFLLMACRQDFNNRGIAPGANVSGVNPASGIPEQASGSTPNLPTSGPALKALNVLGGYPFRDRVSYRIAGRPVTAIELERYKKMMLPVEGKHHGDSRPQQLIKSFVYFWSVVMSGIDNGLATDNRVMGPYKIYRNIVLANQYRKNLETSTVLSGEEVKSLVREDWTRMEFGLRLFENEEEARKFLARIRASKSSLSVKEFGDLAVREFPKTTGLVFRESNFFDPFGDSLLFSLEKGDVSDVVNTGIGPAVCFVKQKIAMDRQEVDAYVDRERSGLVRHHVEAKMREAAKSAKYTLNSENLKKAILEESRGVNFSALPVITVQTRKGVVTITYKDFRIVAASNYSGFFREFPRDAWFQIISPQVTNFAEMFHIGEEADAKGISPDPGWAVTLFEMKEKLLYFAELDRLYRSVDVKVAERDVESYYKENKGLYSHDAMFKISYFYYPDADGIRDLEKVAGSRKEMFEKEELKKYVKTNILTSETKTQKELYKSIHDMKKGDISKIIKADMGYYLVKIEDVKEKGFYDLKDVREEIRGNLITERKKEAVNALLRENINGMKVEEI